MKNKNNYKQNILNFSYKNKNLYKDISINSCNEIAINLIEKWPDWPSDNRITCIYGPSGSGKTHLSNLWMQKANAVIHDRINHLSLEYIYSINKPIIFENLSNNKNWPEGLLFEFINEMRSSNNYLLITCSKNPSKLNWKLNDLISRVSSFTNIEIKLPNDDLIKKILIKCFADRQLSLDKQYIDYISMRIERSYLAINKIVDIIDTLTLQYKQPVNYSLLKEAIIIFDNNN
jgi:chromosomal replication initiation ATPase DnaA